MGKTIALYISSLRKGGAERVIANLAAYFHHEGYRVVLVTTRAAETEYELPEGVIRRISEPSEELLGKGRISDFKTRFLTLRRIWKDERPDAILSFIGKNNMMAILTSLGLKIPVAVSVRGEPSEEYYSKMLRFLARHLFGMAGCVILQTKRCLCFFPKRVRKKAVILKNPMNPSFFRERYEGEREKTITAVGRIDENKNHALLIYAFAKIADKFPGYRLIIYGEGDQMKELNKLTSSLGLKGRIFLPGAIEDVAEAIYKTRVFVLSSNTEGMPNTLIEAMLMGITVVATDCPCGGPAELIVHGENGLLTPVGDIDKMAESLQFLLENPQEADKMGRNAAKTADIYNTEKVYGEWRECLENLMK